MNPSTTGRPLIALIGNQLDVYQSHIATTLRDKLGREGYGLLFVSGGALKPDPHWDEAIPVIRNAIFTLARKVEVDGYIVLTATVGGYASAERLKHFSQEFTHKPVVCIGSPVQGIASVQVDSYAGMSQLMEHITADASRRRLVFLQGPKDSPESCLRECAFRDALGLRGIPVDDTLIVYGNFNALEAYHAMDKLLSHTSNIDAVVAANDDMANGAIHALIKHGLRTPDDVIVSGFDDASAATESLPPLSTVRYSLDEIALQAIQSLKTQMSTGVYKSASNEPLSVPYSVVIRASTQPDVPGKIQTSTRNGPLVFDALKFKQKMLDNLSSLDVPFGLNLDLLVTEIVSRLVNCKQYKGNYLDDALADLHKRPADASWWRHLHEQITVYLQNCDDRGQSSDSLASTMIVLGQIHKSIWSVERRIQVENALFYQGINRYQSRLSRAADMSEFTDIQNSLPEVFSIRSAFICVYDYFGGYPDELARLLYMYPPNCLNHDVSQVFPSTDILPGGFVNSDFVGPLIIEPICTGRTHLGYLVVDLDELKHSVTANLPGLADTIASNLWRCLTSE